MDTLKERSALEGMYSRGISPWALWRTQPSGRLPASVVVDAVPAGL